MNNGNKYNVALYLRLSRDDNDGNKESMSISNQRELLKEYVHERGWSIEDIYIDATDIIGLKQNPTNGRRFSPIFVLSGHFSA